MLRSLALTASLAALTACASDPVLTDSDPSADFSTYRSFAFLEPNAVVAAPPDLNPLLPPRITEATRRELTSKGYSEATDPALADVIVSFTLGRRDRVEVIDAPPYYGPGPYGRPYGWGAPYYGGTDTVAYTEGTLSIDMYDRERKVPVWHGRTSRTITQKLRENAEEVINEAVAEILAKFPPELKAD